MSAIINVSNLTKNYGSTNVLRGVSLAVEAGEFVTLMGSSGSGKTTLLNLIGALDQPDSGIIAVCGTDLTRMTDADRSDFRLRRIGFVFQFFNLLPSLTVRENIQLPLLLLGLKPADAGEQAAAMAAEVGLGGKLDRAVNQLSGGEMQRVGLARALVHRPSLLLADEPTGNLDSKTGTIILELILSTARTHGATVLMATHDHKAAEFCDRTVHMVDGQISDAVLNR